MATSMNDEQGVAKRVGQATSPVHLAKPAHATYQRRLPHIQRPGRPLFVTFNTFHRWHLPASARDIILKCCLFHHSTKLWMHAAVVMPDHVHLLFTPLRDHNGGHYGMAEIMQSIKSVSSRRINQALARCGRVWQTESFDHVLRSRESVRQKAAYICENPVRAGLVESVEDYRWLWREWVEGDDRVSK
jgi:REP element-mobilizing transposase RayT